MARALRTLDPELARRLVVSRQRPAGPEAIMDVATDLASLQLDPIGVVDLGQPPPRAWRDGFA
jgi:hypothetical protein